MANLQIQLDPVALREATTQAIMAVSEVARQVARDHVQSSPDLMDRLKGLVVKVAEKVLAVDADQMAEKMAEAFVKSMQAKERY